MVPHYSIDRMNNAFTRWYEDRTNVHIEWVVVEDEAALRQLNLQLASGDYPDIIMGFNWSPFELTSSVVAAYGAQGIFVPINDYLADNAINLQEYVIPEYPIAEQIVTMPDGQIYSMPYINDCYHCSFTPSKMWIDTAWLETLGLAMPQTTDEFEQVLLAFKQQDPNGNGQADEVPLSTYPGWPIDRFLINPFQLSSGEPWLYNDGGTVTASFMQEGWREGTKYLHRLLDQELLIAEAFTQDADQYRQLVDTDRLGVGPGVVMPGTITGGEPGPWTQWQIMPAFEGPTGLRQSYRDYDEPHVPNVFVITDKCSDPALAVAWADGLYEFEAQQRSIIGVLDEDWRWAEEGEIGIDGEPAIWAPIPEPADAPVSEGDDQTVWGQLSPSFRNAKDRLGQAVLGDPSLDLEVILYEGCRDSLAPYAIDQEVDLVSPVFTPDQAVRISELGTVINSFVQEQFAEQVTGQIDPDDNWQPFLDQLQALGIEEYLTIYQEAFSGQLSSRSGKSPNV